MDIGVHEDGLVHISQICNRYIKHPLEAVKVGEVVKVKVLEVDVKRSRISLTMILDEEAARKEREQARRNNNNRNNNNNNRNNDRRKQRKDRKPKDFDASQIRNSSFRIKQK